MLPGSVTHVLPGSVRICDMRHGMHFMALLGRAWPPALALAELHSSTRQPLLPDSCCFSAAATLTNVGKLDRSQEDNKDASDIDVR